MAGYDVSKRNPLTFHHIVRRSQGGPCSIYNGAVVTHLPHSGIHIISDEDINIERMIQAYFCFYKETKDIDVLREFKQWLEKELALRDFEPQLTKNKLLVYKRRLL